MGDVDLTQVAPAARALWLDGYEWGYQHGVTRGRELCEDEWRGTMAVSAAVARQVAEAGPAANLFDRRGEHAHADELRRYLIAHGVQDG